MIILKNVKKLECSQIYCDFLSDRTQEHGFIRMELGANKVLEISCNSLRGDFSRYYDRIIEKLIWIGISKDYKNDDFCSSYEVIFPNV